MFAAGRRLYVYYRVAPADLARTVAAVRQMQARLEARHPELEARLMRRVEGVTPPPGQATRREAAPAVTLMECYTAAQGDARALADEVAAAAALLPMAAALGDRHEELFEPCP